MAIKNPTARSTWNFSLWWAITGSNWFRSEHHLKEQSDAQMIVSRGCRRLYDRREKRKKARKKHHGADHVMLSFWWAKTGSNWFRSEHHLKEQSDAQMIVSADAGGYMTVEKKGKRQEKRPHGADHMRSSFGGR